ncbi:MAG: hypothetical protein A6F71_10730 [Cycloclasticus sp. symbiont of Poecilosclerida sp. M]|nr:MAG: hypothetical protein A6F71_10730 [Cycloclasticus sp. symbiont of Poecilosclerida sp. M]
MLIKNKSDELDFWFLELARSAAIINKNRLDYLQNLKQTLHSNQIKGLDTLVQSLEQFDFKFSTGWPKEVDGVDKQNIYQYLHKNTDNLLRTKYLNYGSHKANIEFSLNKKNECFLSRGEQKTLSIIFWLTQVAMLVSLKIKPIVLIDDLSSELDTIKINIVLKYLKALKIQTFMTDIGHNLSIINIVNPLVFKINQGDIKGEFNP